MNTDLRYPIGVFVRPSTFSAEQRTQAVETIAALPKNIRLAAAGLSDQQLDTPYRPGGWTVRQTVHHVADSHMQASGRVRMALTENWPIVAPYKENLWAELADARTSPVELSLSLLDNVHARWILLFGSMQPADWARGYVHPENGMQSIDEVAALYAWHGRHHTAHITALRQQMGW